MLDDKPISYVRGIRCNKHRFLVCGSCISVARLKLDNCCTTKCRLGKLSYGLQSGLGTAALGSLRRQNDSKCLSEAPRRPKKVQFRRCGGFQCGWNLPAMQTPGLFLIAVLPLPSLPASPSLRYMEVRHEVACRAMLCILIRQAKVMAVAVRGIIKR